MAKKTLVIDGDREHFSLVVVAGTLHIGDTPTRTEGTLRGLRVVRIHCELEVEEERESVPIDQEGVLAPRILRSTCSVQLTHARTSRLASCRVEASTEATAEIPLPRLSSPEPAPPPTSVLLVQNDSKSPMGAIKAVPSFPLPETGTLTIGKTGGHATIRPPRPKYVCQGSLYARMLDREAS